MGDSIDDDIIPFIKTKAPYTPVPLIYDNNIDVTNINNLLLIDDTVSEHNIFVNSCNINTFPIVYNKCSTRSELRNLLLNKFSLTQLSRIAFVFHNSRMISKKFLNNENFFVLEDIIENPIISENVQFLIDLIKEFNIKNIDYLACNSLQYNNWNKYYDILKTNTDVIVGASDDETGNIKYGGDWLMENTAEDIKNIYFNGNIDNYTSKLLFAFNVGTSLSSNNNIYIKQLSDDRIFYSTTNNADDNVNTGIWYLISIQSDWQVNFINYNSVPDETNRLVVTFLTNITLNNIDNGFVIRSNFVTLDGGNHTFTITDVPQYTGIIGTSNSIGNIIIKNFIIQANGTTTISESSLIVPNSFVFATGTNIIENCVNHCDFPIDNDAGMIGYYAFWGADNATNIVRNCTNHGIIGENGGGICGYNGFNNYGTNTVDNCVNYGNLIGGLSGGILGRLSFVCWNRAFVNNNNVNTVKNCINYGTISQNAENPTSTSAFTTYIGQGGGIVGFNGFVNHTQNNIIENCINYGNIINLTTTTLGNPIPLSGGVQYGVQGRGGILGRAFFRAGVNGNFNNIIRNCANYGNIFDYNNYGIVSNTLRKCSINNCYSIGNILNTDGSAGILGYLNNATTDTCIITNCYSLYGESVYGGLTVVNATRMTFNNCYSPLGTWNTQAAKSALLLNTDQWGYRKVNGNTVLTEPFVLLSMNPINVSVLTELTCFNKDTKILTNNGYVPIQDLRKGDLIKTLTNGFVPIHLIGSREVHNDSKAKNKDKLYVCSNSEYNDVTEDLIITGGHSVLVDELEGDVRTKTNELLLGIFKTEGKYKLPICLDKRAKLYEKEGIFTIYHFALEHTDSSMEYGVYANGLLVESCSIKYLKEKSRLILIE